ncbi:uncharacterized protein [Amphiura filiformis]|uniref:uncharacterized protein isoform X2 n=1 Tax=Amphiura filiformis TaxID=82378 RepID=UPI003B20D977
MANLDYSDPVEITDGGKIIRVRDLVEEADHTVYVRHKGAPLSDTQPYFRVKVVQQAKDAPIAIGVSSETDLDANDIEDDDDEHKRNKDALAYFSDNGAIATPARKGSEEFVQTYGQGDVVGCLVDFHSARKSLICVIKNDRIIYRRWVSIKAEVLYPIINVWWGPVELHVNWLNQSPPSLSMNNLSDWCMPDTVTSDDEHFSLRTSPRLVAIQSPFPWQEGSAYYFELSIVSMGEDAEEGPVIGLTAAIYSDEKLPGKTAETIGYSAANNRIYTDTPPTGVELNEECRCSDGDRMGCGILFVDNTKENKRDTQKVVVYFTKNGKVVHHAAMDQPVGGFYPSVGLAAAGCSVKMNLGCSAPSLPNAAEWCKKATSGFGMFGLGGFVGGKINQQGPRHEEGEQKDGFCFAANIGPPSGNVIRPRDSVKGHKLIQKLETLSREQPYFTAVMVDDSEGIVCIGISRQGQTVGCFPGNLVDTIGYETDGEITSGGGRSTKTKSFTRGDVIGCFVEYFDEVKIVQFVKNGDLVGMAPLSGGDQDLFPSIGFAREPCGVRVTWPSSKPKLPDMFSKDNISSWLKSPGIKLNGNKFCIQKKLRKLKSLQIKSPQPLTRAWSFYEVTIACALLSKDGNRSGKKLHTTPSIGLTNLAGEFTFKKLCDRSEARDIRFYCNTNSVGYKDAMGHALHPVNKKLESGDRLGFGIVYPAVKNQPGDRACQVIVVYCTINGDIIYHRAMEQPAGGFYPVTCLFKYGDDVEIGNQCSPPVLGDISSWLKEAEQLRKDIHKAKKAAGDHRQTAADRKARPASPVERPKNNLNKKKIYIHCDPERYNEATYIQAGLEEKGFTTSLLGEDKLNSSKIAKELLTCVKSCDLLVCCIGPEIPCSKHTTTVLALTKEYRKPVLPAILEHVDWPPSGELQEELDMFTMDKIEFTEDFQWGIGQVEEKSQVLIGKGYNAKKIVVKDGDAAKLLYSDAQKGSKTMNKSSDPDALQRAIDDADKRKATSFGSNEPARPRSTPPTKTSTEAPSQLRAQSAQPRGQVQRNSKACVLL